MVDAGLSFGILGPLEVRSGERPVPLGAAKQRVLLAYLLLRLDSPVSATELYAPLWGERLPSAPKAAIHNYVRRLRRSLGVAAVATTPSGYRLVTEADRVDLYRFRRLVAEAGQCARAGDLAQESRLLRDALTLWRGTPLADVPSDLLQRHEAHALAEERISVLERRIAVELELGANGQLITELRALTGRYPLRERFWAQLILALHRHERSAEALAVYHQARKVLAEEIGIDPGPELQSLYQRVLDGDSALAATTPGEGVAGGPALRRPGPPAQLPADVAGFVGREQLTGALAELLAPESAPTAAPLVVLAGAPGVGKTALAVHAAHLLRERFPDGQLYADLRGFAGDFPATPAELLPRMLRGLGTAPDAVPSNPDEQAALYRSLLSGRAVLIVLDNAARPDQIRPLLPAEPRCAVLVTSRSNLPGLTALEGVRRLHVDVLDPASATRLLDLVVGGGRVGREPAAAAELAGLCGHLPIALRIAGTNLTARPHLTVTDYAAELDRVDRLAALSVPGDEWAAVGAVFAHSYRALDARGRRWFRYLGLMPTSEWDEEMPADSRGTTPEEAAALHNTSPREAAAMLDLLADANLVQRWHTGRYHLHDLLRRYAAQRCAEEDPPAERAAARRRLDRLAVTYRSL